MPKKKTEQKQKERMEIQQQTLTPELTFLLLRH